MKKKFTSTPFFTFFSFFILREATLMMHILESERMECFHSLLKYWSEERGWQAREEEEEERKEERRAWEGMLVKGGLIEGIERGKEREKDDKLVLKGGIGN